MAVESGCIHLSSNHHKNCRNWKYAWMCWFINSTLIRIISTARQALVKYQFQLTRRYDLISPNRIGLCSHKFGDCWNGHRPIFIGINVEVSRSGWFGGTPILGNIIFPLNNLAESREKDEGLPYWMNLEALQKMIVQQIVLLYWSIALWETFT